MRIGVYIDGYNLYYGARSHCGTSTPGWRWLDVRELVRPYAAWSGSTLHRIVYCTARVDAIDSPSASTDQNIYLRALLESGAVDVISEGRYVSWAKEAPLVREPGGAYGPSLYVDAGESWDSKLPLRRGRDKATADPIILATVRKREEKGSDVNVASHLLFDVLSGGVDAAIVISNDSDLELPLRLARQRVPVGTVNPSTNPTAGALKGTPVEGAGRHWWKRLEVGDFRRSQLADPVGKYRKPAGW
ncbi:hypothetical protein GCM10009617_08970 [Leifsonia poae]|uniref:NYN domain-containing protein n=1 Tax=Leifsonia poae TaxID=110933 RepID=A0A9W6LZA0_9MICO|nr:hypothetical protein GCM10017584_09960 [Leifsonia poae]